MRYTKAQRDSRETNKMSKIQMAAAIRGSRSAALQVCESSIGPSFRQGRNRERALLLPPYRSQELRFRKKQPPPPIFRRTERKKKKIGI